MGLGGAEFLDATELSLDIKRTRLHVAEDRHARGSMWLSHGAMSSRLHGIVRMEAIKKYSVDRTPCTMVK